MIRIITLSLLLATFLLSLSPVFAQNTTSSKPTKAEVAACMKQATEKKNMAMKDANTAFNTAKDSYRTSKNKKAYATARTQHTKALRMAKTTFNTESRACKKTKIVIKKPTETVFLSPQNNSGESGTAILEEKDEKTMISLRLSGAPAVMQPAHIHMGSCTNIDSVKYPLSFPLNGTSDTLLDITMAQLKSEFPLAINVHASTTDAGTYVACGDMAW
jgi:Cu/Zn superoxide dismutase